MNSSYSIEKQAEIYMRWREEAVRAIENARLTGDDRRADMLQQMMSLRDNEWVQRGVDPRTGAASSASSVVTFADFVQRHEISLRTVLVPPPAPYRAQYILSRVHQGERVHMIVRDFSADGAVLETPEAVLEQIQHYNRIVSAGMAVWRRSNADRGQNWAEDTMRQIQRTVGEAREFMSYTMVRQFVHLQPE